MKNGQINLTVAIVAGSATVLASLIGAWIGAGERVSKVETNVAVIEEREALHYAEIKSNLESINKKLDQLIMEKE